MAVLAAVVVVLAVILCVNITLTFGVVRRLREHERRLQNVGSGGLGPDAIMLVPGSTVHDYLALTIDDEPISRASLTGDTLVAFLSTTCPSCRDVLPGLVSLARSMPGGRSQVLVVVAGDDDEHDDVFAMFQRELEKVARLARDLEEGQLPVSFGVQGFPAMCVVDANGVVLSSGYELSDISVPAAL